MTGIPELSVSIILVYGLSFAAFGVERARAVGALSDVATHRLHVAVQSFIGLGVMAYCFHESTTPWPVSQKIAVLVHTAVLLMKIHSCVGRGVRARRGITEGLLASVCATVCVAVCATVCVIVCATVYGCNPGLGAVRTWAEYGHE